MKRPKPKKIRKSPRGRQIAALPVRWNGSGEPEVLLVTSRETRRWIIPKGWTIRGKKPWKSARIEAREEAGAEGAIASKAVGAYRYVKVLGDGSGLLCDVVIYPMLVDALKRSWKEKDERERRWFTARRAAKMVDEPELAQILRQLSKLPEKDFHKAF